MKFDKLPVLVCGDVMLDHYISGSVARISPEAPVPVVSRKNSWSVPGGAANVALGLARLECEPRLIGLVGNDAAGETLRQQTAAEGMKAALITSQARPTTCKTRIMAQGQQLLRLDEETCQEPDPTESASLKERLDNLLPGVKSLILSDYAKGVLLAGADKLGLASYAIAKAREQGIPVLVDPKGADWSRYAGASCVTPNTKEFIAICHALGLWQNPAKEPTRPQRKALAEAVCQHFNFERLLLTRGSRGMTLFIRGEEPEYIRAAMREVADVSGAGDTVIAVLAACVGIGEDWRKAARVANAAAGVAVTKLGAAPVSMAELNQALEAGRANPKLCTWRELQENLRLWRDNGQRIVFTNGCFDLLHPGHISLLRQSAALGDRLVVGLNSDASVRRLKGPTRPIQGEQARAMLLGALQDVDSVILFDEDTPAKLIEAIRPDFLVKGSDYQVENIAGAKFVQSYGGQVRLVDLVDGFSTTEIAHKIQGSKVCP